MPQTQFLLRLTLLLLLQVPLAGFAAEAPPGAVLYQQHCAICHGEKGRGDGLAGKALNPPPRDFSKGQFRYSKNEAERLNFIKKGKGAMPGWEQTLTDTQIKAILKFIYSLKTADKKAH